MMHNSLLIADRLREANRDRLALERRDPHRLTGVLKPGGPARPGEFVLTGAWSVEAEADFPGIQEASADLTDFLKRSGLAAEGVAIGGSFVLQAEPAVAAGGFRRTADAGIVKLAASDIRGIWAAIVYLEKELAASGRAVIAGEALERSPAWDVQIGQAPYGANYLVPDLTDDYLSDDAFRLLIHYGVNGLTIYGDWLLYVNGDVFPELAHPEYERHICSLREAAERAGKYGVSLYYVPVSPKLDGNHPLFARIPSARGSRISPGLKTNGKRIYNLCSSDPASLAFHGATMANLFREVPELGGLMLIIGGESYYHCFMRPDLNDAEEGLRTNCPRCRALKPEEAVNRLIRATAEAVHGVKPGAPVMAWPYSAFVWSSDPAQLALLNGMSPEAALLTTIEKDEWAEKGGYSKLIWDYSVDYTGPAGNLLLQASKAREKGIPLYVKTETALGLECLHIPYWPAIGRLNEKWRNVSALKPAGVLQSWMFFGMWGSRAEELGWWAAWHPDRPLGDTIRMMAERDFGPHAEAFLRAWERMGEAAGHLPYIPQYFTGPEFIGPAHPLVFGGEPECKEEYEALLYYLQENEETFSSAVNEVKHSLALSAIPYGHMQYTMRAKNGQPLVDILIAEYGTACECAREAYEEVAALAGVDGNEAAAVTEERLLIEYVYRTLLTTVHTYRFLLANENGDRTELLRIARKEAENTASALELLGQAPWLDLSRRNDGLFPSSVAMMRAKLASLESEFNAANS